MNVWHMGRTTVRTYSMSFFDLRLSCFVDTLNLHKNKAERKLSAFG